MRDRGKRLGQLSGEQCFNLDASMELPCKKHPSSSSASYAGGICPFCLHNRLAQLVCPHCGEQRLPNCSCSSAFSQHRTGEPQIPLRRSNSTCISDINPRGGGGLWGIKKLFRKKREKGRFDGDPIEAQVSDSTWGRPTVIQRSRSVTSYRGARNSVSGGVGGAASFFFDNVDDGGMPHSAARASSVSGGFVTDSAKMSCFSESETRMSNFECERDTMARGVFTMREGYEFSYGEDPKFIDLKLDIPSSSSSEFRRHHSVNRMPSNDFYGAGEPGRFSVSETETRRYRKSRKGWGWLFKVSSNMGKDKG